MPDVYIAGSMTGRHISDVLLERAEAKAILSIYGLTWYDPADDEGLEKVKPNKIISNSFDYEKMEHYVSKDLNAVSKCRSVLNITGDLPSEGSTWEMAYAVYHRQIPVILVGKKRLSGEKMTFTNILVDEIHGSLPEAIASLAKRLQEDK